MTLCNLIVQPHRAFLITDTARYDANGAVLRYAPKLLVIPEMNLAMGFSGRVTPEMVEAELRDLATRGIERFLNGLGGILCGAVHRHSIRTDSNILLAYFSLEQGQPGGAHLSVGTGAADYWPSPEPWGLNPAIPEDGLPGGYDGLCDPAIFNPEEPMALIERQRLVTEWPGMPDGCYIGGDIQLTTVSAAGVETRTLSNDALRDIPGRNQRRG